MSSLLVHEQQPAPGAAASFDELVTVIDDAVDRLNAQILDGAVSDRALNDSIVVLHRLEARLHGEKLRRLAELDARRSYTGDAAMSTAAWAAARLGLTRGEAKTLAVTAVGLARLPRTAARLRAGELGAGQAHAAVRALDELTDSHREQSAPAAEDAETGADRNGAGTDGQAGGETGGQPGGTGDAGAAGDAGGTDAADRRDRRHRPARRRRA